MTHTEAADMILWAAHASPMDSKGPSTQAAILAAVATVMDAARADALEEAASAMRLQGQSEGFVAAVHWLRDRNASVRSVDAPLKASEWADMLEDSRIAKSHREIKP